MSKAAPTKHAVLGILKKIQGSLADVRNAQVDIRRDIREPRTQIQQCQNVRNDGRDGESLRFR